MHQTAIVMNMFYTGLGIARSLGERGIPVIGLTARRGIYGNFTRHARIVFCPDSRSAPDALLTYLLRLGKELGHRAVVFPTRDDDLVFLNRYRDELSPHFVLAIPESAVLNACLNKWETYLWAQRAEVASPRSWLIESPEDLSGKLDEVAYPCVIKPLSSHTWRQGGNWHIVGARKAIGIYSREELIKEYDTVAHADQRVLLQEMVPGGDESLVIVACLLDRDSKWVAGFNLQKVVQVPEGFGTGCIVRTADHPELLGPTAHLLQKMSFTGIAEVEYKWDSDEGCYKLIEINPRPWDQHRLGRACGVDVTYLAYCEYAGLPRPVISNRFSEQKWIAEDAFITTALSLLWKRDDKIRSFLEAARGKRVYAIWSVKDPLPSLAYLVTGLIPALASLGARAIWSRMKSILFARTGRPERPDLVPEKHLKRERNHG